MKTEVVVKYLVIIAIIMTGLISSCSSDSDNHGKDNAGDIPSEQPESVLQMAMNKVPGGGRLAFIFTDVQELRNTPDMDALYTPMETTFNRAIGPKLGIEFSQISCTYYTDVTQIHEGEFDELAVESTLTASSLDYQVSDGIEMWKIKLLGEEVWVCVIEGIIITGINPINLVECLDTIKDDGKDSLYWEPDVMKTVELLPDQTLVEVELGRFKRIIVYVGLELSVGCTQLDEDEMVLYTGILKFDEVENAKQAYNRINQETSSIVWGSWQDFNFEHDGAMIWLTARQSVSDIARNQI